MEAQLAAIDKVRPGVKISDIDAVARKILSRSKWPVYEHGTGHGLGLKVHEQPALSRQSKTVLEEGMVITIEPGLYIPGRFGIRIEDDVLITRDGHEVLTSVPKELEDCLAG